MIDYDNVHAARPNPRIELGRAARLFAVNHIGTSRVLLLSNPKRCLIFYTICCRPICRGIC